MIETSVSKQKIASVHKDIKEHETKADKARVLYKELIKKNPNVSRKELIEAFVEQCGLTPKGAATYTFNIKKEYKEGKI
jgi:hypothetical protein